ncbi:MAG: FliM/FliN family flagellar motor C-terminal domain-containing protein, partial [Pseudooceanicola nanhaiensis]
GLAIEATDFTRYRMRLDVAGARDGEVTLALPLREAAPQPSADEGAEGEAPASVPLSPVVMAARARLDAELHRFSLPLAEVGRLKPGDLLEVPRSALSDTILEAGPRHRIAAARLGQLNGFRAVRLTPAEGAAAAGHVGTGPPPAEPPAPEAEAAPPDAAEGGGLPEPGTLPAPGAPMEMGELPSFDDLPELGDLPQLDDLPELDDLPQLDGEAEELPDFGAAPMPGLPPLGD